MSERILINPNGQLMPMISELLREARKTKPIWARRVEVACEVQTLEGRLHVKAGDYLCRGIIGEQWPQKESKLLEKYLPTGDFQEGDWQRFDPKPESAPVEAAQVKEPFRVIAHWGELNGKANDYVVRSRTDQTDVWIVDKAIFEASYEF